MTDLRRRFQAEVHRGARVSPDAYEGVLSRARRRSRNRRLQVILLALVIAAGGGVVVLRSLPAGGRSAGTAFRPTPPPATPCQQVIPQCHARRLPNIILTGGRTSGALGPVDGLDLSRVISFDDALRRAWANSTHEDAKTVQVTLGSADATKLRWGTGKRLYYAIEWEGICVPVIAPTPVPGYSPPPRCGGTHWGTVIDATTGKFVVEGSA